MPDRHIIAGSAGLELPRFGPVMRYALEVCGAERPRICHIGTAGGDHPGWGLAFYDAAAREDVRPRHLALFPMPSFDPAELLEQDVIWVGGGSVANLLALWRLHGLDVILREAWERGIVLGGVSAGAICWHVGGTTDSFGLDLRPVTNGLGWLPYSCGVHYDSEAQRRPLFESLIGDGVLPAGYATDDGVAIHYVGTDVFRVVTQVAGAHAYRVTAGGEQTLVADLLPA
jgi:peptidase E